MKGIAHFVTGVAIATFFPEVVERAAAGSVLPVLGGMAGVLPDTIDFRFVRFFEEYDLEIDPGPEPDAHEVAQQLAKAMRRAYQSGEPRNVMLHTIRLSADLWRRYAVRFDPARGEVAVRIGPIVNTAQVALVDSELSSSSVPADGRNGAGEARIRVGVPMVQTYDDEVEIDIFSGPSFRFERRDDRLRIHFLDWHRRWSHSLTLATALGLGAAGIAAGLEFATQAGPTGTPLWVGLVTGLGFAAHIVEDQLGYMGSNLLYPFTRGRTSGLQLLRSGDPIPNFLTVWTSLMLILFNLDRFSARPRFDPAWFLGLAVALPLLVLIPLYQVRRRHWSAAAESLRQGDVLSEAERVEMS